MPVASSPLVLKTLNTDIRQEERICALSVWHQIHPDLSIKENQRIMSSHCQPLKCTHLDQCTTWGYQ